MKNEPVDKYFGMPLSEWVERIPNELEMDAVGLWQIIPVGKDSFCLTGEELRNFTKLAIIKLLEHGAVPVRASQKKDEFWVHQKQYGNQHEEIAESIINEWGKNNIDPDVDGIWFARMRNGNSSKSGGSVEL